MKLVIDCLNINQVVIKESYLEFRQRRRSPSGTKRPSSDEIWRSAFPLAVVQNAWINFGLRHTAAIQSLFLNFCLLHIMDMSIPNGTVNLGANRSENSDNPPF